MELLPKSFNEFRRYFSVSVSSTQTIKEAYNEYEAQRKDKLNAAKRQREQMKRSEGRLPWPTSTADILPLSLGKQVQKRPVVTRSANVEDVCIHLPHKVGGL